jgi:hypothetical protein
MEAARTSETSVDNYFTRKYIPEDNSELHTRCRENFKCHIIYIAFYPSILHGYRSYKDMNVVFVSEYKSQTANNLTSVMSLQQEIGMSLLVMQNLPKWTKMILTPKFSVTNTATMKLFRFSEARLV